VGEGGNTHTPVLFPEGVGEGGNTQWAYIPVWVPRNTYTPVIFPEGVSATKDPDPRRLP